MRTTKFGPCCGCGTTRGVRNVLLLDRRAPIAGKGWGCVLCGLPPDGASAVLCGDCMESSRIEWIVAGYLSEGGRVRADDYPYEPFAHDMRRHDPREPAVPVDVVMRQR